MGSFNISCFATNQTIAEGDACRVLPVIQEGTYSPVQLSRGDEKTSAFGVASSTCYPDSFWKPAGGFIKAEYDDFGRVTLNLDPLMRAHVMSIFLELLQYGYVTAQGENSSHDLPFDLPAFLAASAPGVFEVLQTQQKSHGLQEGPGWRDGELDAELVAVWHYMWEVAFKQRLFINHRGVPRAFNFAIVHEATYQAFVKRVADGNNWNNEPMAPLAMLGRGLDAAREQLKGYSALPPEQVFTKGFRLADLMRSTLGQVGGQSYHLPGVASNSLTTMALAVVEQKMTEDDFIEHLVPFVEDQYVHKGFYAMNVRIVPMVTAGQDYDNSTGVRYAEFVTEVSATIVRGRLEHMYGPFQAYTMRAVSEAEVEKVSTEMREWDGAIENVVMTPVEGQVAVSFNCTFDLETLQEVLADEGFALMAQTVALAEPPPATSEDAVRFKASKG